MTYAKTYRYSYKNHVIEFAVDPYDSDIFVVTESFAAAVGYAWTEPIRRLSMLNHNIKLKIRNCKRMRVLSSLDLYSIHRRTRQKRIEDLCVWCLSMLDVVARDHRNVITIGQQARRINSLITQLRSKNEHRHHA